MAHSAKKSAAKSSGKSASKAAPVAKSATKKSSNTAKKTDASVDTKSAAPIDREKAKIERLDEIGVPKARRGENLHEQNPDLQAAIIRNKIL